MVLGIGIRKRVTKAFKVRFFHDSILTNSPGLWSTNDFFFLTMSVLLPLNPALNEEHSYLFVILYIEDWDLNNTYLSFSQSVEFSLLILCLGRVIINVDNSLARQSNFMKLIKRGCIKRMFET